MDKETKRMIGDYELSCNIIAEAFLNKQNDAPDAPPLKIDGKNIYWAGDEVGGMLCHGDENFSFNDILTDLREDAPVGELARYNDYRLRCSYCGLEEKQNYRSWLHGAPRYSEERLERIEKLKDELYEYVEQAELNKTKRKTT